MRSLGEIPSRSLYPIVGLGVLGCGRLRAGTGLRIAQLTPFAPVGLSTLNESVSLSGGMALVGVPDSDMVYFFRDDGQGHWNQIAAFDDNIAGSQRFGNSVSLDGRTAVVGTVLGGNAEVFTEDAAGTWNLAKVLVPNDPANAQGFGRSVSVSGEHVLVGAERDDGIGGPGSAYIFDGGQNWARIARLAGSPIDDFARFGSSVALDGDTALIGCAVRFLHGDASLRIRVRISRRRHWQLVASR